MPIENINGRDVHIQELNVGAAGTVLLVHGMFSNLSVYYFHIAPVLARHFHVVMYDLKSHGMSAKSIDGYDLLSMAEDLKHLMDHLNIERVHLAGYSFGGLIALKMAALYPERIRKLVLMEAPNPDDEKTRGIIDEYSREFLEHYIENFTDVTKVKMGKRQMERNHRMYEYLFYQSTLKADMLREHDFFRSKELAAIPAETLLLYGSYSNCMPAALLLDELLEHASLRAIEGDHNIPIQQPQRIAEQMDVFFRNP